MIWQLTQNKEWATLEKQFSWVDDMKYVPQHKIHHAEGNVAIHTQMVINTLHLKLLSEADARGRICEDLGFLLDSLELFEMFCREQDCWGKPKYFAAPNARFRYLNTPDSYVDYIPFDDFKSEVTLMSGLPGMGKDHYIQSLDKDILVVSLDAIRRKHKISPTGKSGNEWVVQTAKEEARSYLRKG